VIKFRVFIKKTPPQNLFLCAVHVSDRPIFNGEKMFVPRVITDYGSSAKPAGPRRRENFVGRPRRIVNRPTGLMRSWIYTFCYRDNMYFGDNCSRGIRAKHVVRVVFPTIRNDDWTVRFVSALKTSKTFIRYARV